MALFVFTLIPAPILGLFVSLYAGHRGWLDGIFGQASILTTLLYVLLGFGTGALLLWLGVLVARLTFGASWAASKPPQFDVRYEFTGVAYIFANEKYAGKFAELNGTKIEPEVVL